MESSRLSVDEFLALARSVLTDEQSREVLKGRGFFDVDAHGKYVRTRKLDLAVSFLLPVNERNRLVLWDKDGNVDYVRDEVIVPAPAINPRPASSVFSAGSSSGTRNVSVAELNRIFNSVALGVRKDDITDSLIECLREIPGEYNTYDPKEVKIVFFENSESTFRSLIGAGTRVIDAILFKHFMKSNIDAFDISTLPPNPDGTFTISDAEICRKISVGHKALTSAFVFVYNQGYLPQLNETKQLPKFIRETVFHNELKNQGELANLLSSASLKKFPGSAFLFPDISNLLPSICVARCRLNVAGNRVIRYAAMANCFENRFMFTPAHNRLNLEADNIKIAFSIEIRTFLASLESDFEAQCMNHPFSETKVILPGLTKKLTHAVLYSLSIDGLRQMASRVVSENRLSWKKDIDFWGISTSNDIDSNIRTYPVFDESVADFSGLSIETIRGVWGKQ
uniref:Coat protein n=1 Tax=Zostera ophiovirus TaxID=2983965 RepID=A0A9N7ABF3_9VIRU|nr:TPA_asm: coat protein [Zostera ophiovirus]